MDVEDRSVRSNMKKKLLLGLSLVASLASLAGCDSIEAKLKDSDYKDTILKNSDGSDPKIVNNEQGKIYDALVSAGSTNSEKVLKNILLLIANNKFGTFYKEGDVDGIREVVAKGGSTLTAFAEAHKDVYPNGASDVIRLHNFILERINRTFLSATTNASYAENNKFFEEKFYKAQQENLYELGEIADTDFKGIENDKSVGVQTIASIAYNEENGFGSDIVKNYFNDDYLDIYKDYIEKTILEDMMRRELVHRYILNNNYVALGRSAARKVQYVTLEDNADYPNATQSLMAAYSRIVLANKVSNETLALSAEEKAAIAEHYATDYKDLNFLGDLYKGLFDSSLSANLLSAARKVYTLAGFTEIAPSRYPSDFDYSALVYEQTTYGGYIRSYEKIYDATNGFKDRYTIDSSVWSEFTGSNAHSPQTGMKFKVQSLIPVDKTSEGWYTDANLGTYSSTYKTRLFKNTVASDVVAGTTGNAAKNYGWYVDGSYYLTRETYENTSPNAEASSYDPTPYLIKDGSNWYITRVDEAIKNSKMRESSSDYYGKDSAILREIETEIGYMLSDNSSYEKNANQHYVEQAAISFHDQAIYDYFKTTFPDLFED